MKSNRKPRLGQFGRGEPTVPDNHAQEVEAASCGVRAVPLADIEEHPALPRRIYRDESLDRLARDVEEHGQIHPVVLVSRPGGGYWLVAGRRRRRASERLGRGAIEAVVRTDLDDELAALKAALAENDEREDVSYLERAWYYAAIVDRGIAQADLAAERAQDKSTVSQIVTIGRALTPELLERAEVEDQVARYGHARLYKLAMVQDEAARVQALRLAAGIGGEERPEPPAEPSIKVSARRAGGHIVRIAPHPPEVWTSTERRRAIEVLGPVVDGARELDGEEPPLLARAREEWERRERELVDENRRLAVQLADSARHQARAAEEARQAADRDARALVEEIRAATDGRIAAEMVAAERRLESQHRARISEACAAAATAKAQAYEMRMRAPRRRSSRSLPCWLASSSGHVLGGGGRRARHPCARRIWSSLPGVYRNKPGDSMD